MAEQILADTSGWATWLVRSQALHARAVDWLNRWHAEGSRLVTTNYILAELVALLTSPLRIPRTTQIAFLTDLQSASWVEIVHVDPGLDHEAWNLWKSRPDKDWSLVDCASFALMQRRAISEALTTDHHFEQAGFVRLLK